MDYYTLSAVKGLQEIHNQTLSSETWVNQCLERIHERDSLVGAWEYLNPDYARQQAQACDAKQGAIAPLHGVPVGIKDIFATHDMPTQWGTPVHAGQHFSYDAAVVERLRAAGAVILGKTVTTEYASGIPSRTRNPHNLNHTPGASSSGSVAAVADGMVPVAIGSQTMGSVIRPASYCGIFGYKPSFGLISRFGGLAVSRELDHVGVFARNVADLALLGSVLVGSDRRDPDCWLSGHPDPAAWVLSPLAHPPTIAMVRGPFWELADAESQAMLLQSAERLENAGATVVDIALPAEFEVYLEHAESLMAMGMAVNHARDYDQEGDRLSSKFRQIIEQGRSRPSMAYAQARHATSFYNQTLSQILTQFDIILTPATTGTAPEGLDFTGNPVFCVLWTLCGMPAVTVPAGKGANGLPLGVQLVGDRGQDIALLNMANWVTSVLLPKR